MRLHTTNFILDEVYTYFCKVHEVAVDDEDRAWQILKAFADKAFSYTDATSFAWTTQNILAPAEKDGRPSRLDFFKVFPYY